MIPIQIRCKNITAELPEMAEIEAAFNQAFDRFSHFIREAQLTLIDTNGPKGGVDKQCTIKLRFYPRGLAVVKADGISFPQAANIACDKMQQIAAKRLNKRKTIQLRSWQVEAEGERVRTI